MLRFKHLVRSKPVVILSGQASSQNFDPLSDLNYFACLFYFSTNDSLLKNVHGILYVLDT